MFGVETFLSMLFVKCHTRQEQVYLVVGMAILTVCCLGICKFTLGMSEAAMDTEISSGDIQRDVYQIGFYGYLVVGISGLLALVFAFMGVLNLIRLLTNTGLDDPDEGW